MSEYWMLGASHGHHRLYGASAPTAFDRLALGLRTGRPESVTADPGSPTHAGSPDLARTADTGADTGART